MPLLDRRIEVQENRGTHVLGKFVDDWQTLASVWAQRRGAGTIDRETVGGIEEVEAVQFTVRYTPALASAAVGLLRVNESGGGLWNVEGRTESDRRRRFLTFSCARSS
ncbi:MAG: head-tail adaptor protein [Chromatiales bacterium]|nr:head-tail adaptor protein [Chromatiales bacterium]